MKTYNFAQGSPDWHKHRNWAVSGFFSASDAASMLGCKGAHSTRDQLLRVYKYQIPQRVTAVNQGFDLACQSQLFSSDVARLAENSRRMESRGKCSQVKPRVRVGLNWTDEKLEEEIGYAIDLGKDQVMV